MILRYGQQESSVFKKTWQVHIPPEGHLLIHPELFDPDSCQRQL